ncbi:hypothetical protein PFFCH_03937 [Plasmodium falciparum FCH/4]|uniref:Uncharacterized protein n=1 Tax=Plasmodium falciparum FCH/4 TaxID=1036724 RepID=A0A024VKZ5_PLAFA|nr:hypothetical protein PFFCH_03937 [Plasmodium falciparum FCH/4]
MNIQTNNCMSGQENNYLNSQTNNYMNIQTNNYMNIQTNNYMNIQTNNYMNGQENNYMNGQTNNFMNDQTNNFMNGQTNNFMNDQTNNYMNSQVHTEIPYRPNENAQTSSQIMNGKHNYDHTMVGNIQDGKGINTHAKHKLYEIKKNDDHDIIDEDTSNNEDLERQNKNKDDEVDMIEKIENMSLFFTNILNEKYDFNFLKDENIKNNKKKTLVQWIISGLYDKDNYKRNEEDKEKRQKNTKQLKHSTKLENYKSIIEDNKGRIKYYDAYSILYNFEYSLSLLIRTSFKVQHYGVFKKDKEIFVHEIYEDNYNNIYFYDYINDIQENQISEIFNNMNKQDNFRSLLFDLLKIKWYKFYANLFSYIIILTSLLNFFFLFFINHISFLIKHKKKFLLVSIPIWISVFFMSLIGTK